MPEIPQMIPGAGGEQITLCKKQQEQQPAPNQRNCIEFEVKGYFHE